MGGQERRLWGSRRLVEVKKGCVGAEMEIESFQELLLVFYSSRGNTKIKMKEKKNSTKKRNQTDRSNWGRELR